jgi:hypothetical protein
MMSTLRRRITDDSERHNPIGRRTRGPASFLAGTCATRTGCPPAPAWRFVGSRRRRVPRFTDARRFTIEGRTAARPGTRHWIKVIETEFDSVGVIPRRPGIRTAFERRTIANMPSHVVRIADGNDRQNGDLSSAAARMRQRRRSEAAGQIYPATGESYPQKALRRHHWSACSRARIPPAAS